MKINTKRNDIRFEAFTATVCSEVFPGYQPCRLSIQHRQKFPDTNSLHQPLKMETKAVFETEKASLHPKILLIRNNTISIIHNSVIFNYVNCSHHRI